MYKLGYVYIITNKSRRSLYVGFTAQLYTRIYQHKMGEGAIWPARYKCKYLVYYEIYEDLMTGIRREKQLKKWKRQYKIDLINEFNPDWKDLFNDVEGFE